VKRLCLLGMALAGLLTAGITTAATARTPSSGPKKPAKVKPAHKPKPVTTKVRCKLALVTQPPSDDTSITPGTSGTQYGTAGCGRPLLEGVVSADYTQDAAGDVIAPYSLWTRTGTLSGRWKLVPTEQVGPPSSTPFTAQTYAGTATVTGGSGAWSHATGKATLKCATLDSVHFACTESLKVTTPPVLTRTR
jgi:hypothetical protein